MYCSILKLHFPLDQISSGSDIMPTSISWTAATSTSGDHRTKMTFDGGYHGISVPVGDHEQARVVEDFHEMRDRNLDSLEVRQIRPDPRPAHNKVCAVAELPVPARDEPFYVDRCGTTRTSRAWSPNHSARNWFPAMTTSAR